jgi:restriction endonuclease
MKAQIESNKSTIEQIEDLLDTLAQQPNMDRSSVHAIIYKMRLSLNELKRIQARANAQSRPVVKWGVNI